MKKRAHVITSIEQLCFQFIHYIKNIQAYFHVIDSLYYIHLHIYIFFFLIEWKITLPNDIPFSSSLKFSKLKIRDFFYIKDTKSIENFLRFFSSDLKIYKNRIKYFRRYFLDIINKGRYPIFNLITDISIIISQHNERERKINFPRRNNTVQIKQFENS